MLLSPSIFFPHRLLMILVNSDDVSSMSISKYKRTNGIPREVGNNFFYTYVLSFLPFFIMFLCMLCLCIYLLNLLLSIM